MRMNYIVYCELRQRNQIKYVRPVELPRPEKHDFAKHTFYSNLRLMHFGVHTNIGLVADAFFLPLSSCLHPNVQCTCTYVLNIRIAKRERMLICAIFDLTHFCHVMIYKHVLAGGTGSVLNHSKRILSQKRLCVPGNKTPPIWWYFLILVCVFESDIVSVTAKRRRYHTNHHDASISCVFSPRIRKPFSSGMNSLSSIPPAHCHDIFVFSIFSIFSNIGNKNKIVDQ